MPATWNEAFETGELPEMTEQEAEAFAAIAWAHCLFGIGKTPEKFGEVMGKLHEKHPNTVGIIP